MNSQCSHSRLKSTGTIIPCASEVVFFDALGNEYCKHCAFKYGRQPIALIVEPDDNHMKVEECGSENERHNLSRNHGAIGVKFVVPTRLGVPGIILLSRSSPYTSFSEFMLTHMRFLPKAKYDDWRLLSIPVLGEINGLPTFRGMAVATNGVHVAIETSAGELIVGHLKWFIVDPKERDRVNSDLFEMPVRKVEKMLKGMEELFT